MSIPRKRGKVKKKKTTAAKKVVRKKAASKPAKKKRSKARKRPLSVDTKPTKVKPKGRTKPRPSKPKPKPKPKPSKKLKPSGKKSKARVFKKFQAKQASKKRKKKSVKSRTPRPPKRMSVSDRLQFEHTFLTQPAVSEQIRERIIEKGLAEITRGMIQTPESYMLGQLIIAEQLGNFDTRAYELAQEFHWSPQEVYELWHSPEPHLG